MKRTIRISSFILTLALCAGILTAGASAAKTGWVQSSGYSWRYYDDEDTFHTGWLQDNGKWYYLDPTDGIMVDGRQNIDGKIYYFDLSGVMQTGWVKTEYDDENAWYYYDENGVAHDGWLEDNGHTYYILSGKMLADQSAKIDGINYYFKADGTLVSGVTVENGQLYCFDAEGNPRSGWVDLDGIWGYFDERGAGYTGWLEDKGKNYYINNGVMCTGISEIDGQTYCFSSSGVMQVGWVQAGGEWYYFEENGAGRNGWMDYKGNWYYIWNGWMCTGFNELPDGRSYYFGDDGVMRTGWVESGGEWYYFDENGMDHDGWLKYDGKWYFIDWMGARMVWNEPVHDAFSLTPDLDIDIYYVDKNGVLDSTEGWKYSPLYDSWYYVRNGKVLRGVQEIDGRIFFFGLNGDLGQTYLWYNFDGTWYFFDTDGAMCTGSFYVDGAWYYTDPDAASDLIGTYWEYDRYSDMFLPFGQGASGATKSG